MANYTKNCEKKMRELVIMPNSGRGACPRPAKIWLFFTKQQKIAQKWAIS